MTISILKVFNFNMLALLHSGANLSFVTSYLSKRFDVTTKSLLVTFFGVYPYW